MSEGFTTPGTIRASRSKLHIAFGGYHECRGSSRAAAKRCHLYDRARFSGDYLGNVHHIRRGCDHPVQNVGRKYSESRYFALERVPFNFFGRGLRRNVAWTHSFRIALRPSIPFYCITPIELLNRYVVGGTVSKNFGGDFTEKVWVYQLPCESLVKLPLLIKLQNTCKNNSTKFL